MLHISIAVHSLAPTRVELLPLADTFVTCL